MVAAGGGGQPDPAAGDELEATYVDRSSYGGLPKRWGYRSCFVRRRWLASADRTVAPTTAFASTKR